MLPLDFCKPILVLASSRNTGCNSPTIWGVTVDTSNKLMDCATDQFEATVSNHLGWKGTTYITNKEFHNTEDFLFIEGFEGLLKDEDKLLCQPARGSILTPYGSVGAIDNVIMEYVTKGSEVRQGRSAAFSLWKGFLFNMISS
eukprot:10276860-Ditylum_brightwellii.AAC.1